MTSPIETFLGTCAVPGQALGRATWVAADEKGAPDSTLLSGTPAERWHDTREAIGRTLERLEQIADREKKRGTHGVAEIMDANAQMLSDPEFLGLVESDICENNKNPHSALLQAGEHFAKQLEDTGDPYLVQRATDVRYVVGEVVRGLVEGGATEPEIEDEPVVLLAQNINFVQLFRFDLKQIAGIGMIEGSENDHAVIIAKQLGIPTLIRVGEALRDVRDGSWVAVDSGTNRLNTGTTKQAVEHLVTTDKHQVDEALLAQSIHECVHGPDGSRIEVRANVARLSEVEMGATLGADGIGLVRTEFLFGGNTPSEQDQYETYLELADPNGHWDIVVRLFDFGADKAPPALGLTSESNPALGVRGVRLLLARAETLLKPQLRAILRAAARVDLKIVIPMVSRPEEIRSVKSIIGECEDELSEAGTDFKRGISLGTMIEVPSAALRIETILSEVDFVSIGTNDLTQYTLAADRSHPDLGEFFEAPDPAVLILIKSICNAADAVGKPASVCGEMASDAQTIGLLLKAGVTGLSVPPREIPGVKRRIQDWVAAES